jgi:hypothetical protein
MRCYSEVARRRTLARRRGMWGCVPAQLLVSATPLPHLGRATAPLPRSGHVAAPRCSLVATSFPGLVPVHRWGHPPQATCAPPRQRLSATSARVLPQRGTRSWPSARDSQRPRPRLPCYEPTSSRWSARPSTTMTCGWERRSRYFWGGLCGSECVIFFIRAVWRLASEFSFCALSWVLRDHAFQVFYVGHLKQSTQKISSFGVDCLRRPTQKIVYFWCRSS